MSKPMPSPRGTNHERLFMSEGRRGAAYDAAILDDDKATALRQFLTGKLDADDVDAALAIVTGREESGSTQASDRALRPGTKAYDAMFPHANRLKVGG